MTTKSSMSSASTSIASSTEGSVMSEATRATFATSTSFDKAYTAANLSSQEDCSLYVGDLDFSVTEAHLFSLFSEFGQVVSIRVAKDNLTKKSLGYAFVNYSNAEDAQRALNDSKPKLISNKPIRVMEFQRDPALRKHNQNGNIFIKNLDPSIDSNSLMETFSNFGKIMSCKIAVDEAGNSRGFGYVLFEDLQSANQAIEKMNGILMNDRPVSVSHHVSKRERLNKYQEMKENFTNLYIKNIDSKVSEQEFKHLFDEHGTITSFSLPVDENGFCRGFGFVNYDNHQSAMRAIESLHDFEYKNKRLYVNRAQKKMERLEELRQQEYLKNNPNASVNSKFQGTNLYIKYLDVTVDDQELSQLFSAFGTITSAKIMTDDQGQSRGFGFVCFSNPSEAQTAIKEMNEKEVKGNRIFVSIAQRRNDYTNQSNNNNRFRLQQQAFPSPMSGINGVNGMNFIPPPFYYQYHPAMPLSNKWMPPRAGPGGPINSGNGRFIPKNNNLTNINNNNNNNNNGNNGNSGKIKGKGRNFKNNQQDFAPSLTAAIASAATPEAEKQVIGEAIYPKVQGHPGVRGNSELAGKVTGMLLEHDNDALLKWVDDEPTLKRHINQAYEAYMEYLKNDN